MEYPKEFESLLNSTQETMIGLGNPNAKILIIACEPSIPEDDLNGIEREIKKNKSLWLKNIKNPKLMDEWLRSFDQDFNPCKGFEYGYPNYNPLFPYYGQKNSPFTRKNGTSRSWWYYQKIIDGILKTPKPNNIDFLLNCFVTDLSAENAINQNQTIKMKTQRSIDNRISGLFSHVFFQNFPIVIMCCGHYVKNYGVMPNELFKVPFLGEKHDKNGEWINYHYDNGGTPKLLLHTKHLTARRLKAKDYIAEIVGLCRLFIDENNIKL